MTDYVGYGYTGYEQKLSIGSRIHEAYETAAWMRMRFPLPEDFKRRYDHVQKNKWVSLRVYANMDLERLNFILSEIRKILGLFIEYNNEFYWESENKGG